MTDVSQLELVPVKVAVNGSRFEMTELGLASELPENMRFETWAKVTVNAIGMAKGIQWTLGDLLNVGEVRYGEEYAQVAEITGYEEPSLANMKWVSGAIPYEDRWPELSWSHHRVVAGIEDREERQEWLQKAYDEGWTKNELAKAVKQTVDVYKDDKPKPRRLISDVDTEARELVEAAQDLEESSPELVSRSRQELAEVWEHIDNLAALLD